jgi:hypothetical protein
MSDSDIRIARLLQAAAVLTTSGHCREDAILTAFDLEKKIIELVKTQGETCQIQS